MPDAQNVSKIHSLKTVWFLVILSIENISKLHDSDTILIWCIK